MTERTRKPSLQRAFVLHQRAYRETSSLVEVFSERWGRVGVIAKGARRPRSPFRGLLQPFSPLLLSWSARSELGTLTGAELASPPHALVGEALFHALYLNELLVRTLHRDDPHPELFTSYAVALGALVAARGSRAEGVLRRFEVDLLNALGYAMVLDHAVNTGEALVPGDRYRYVAERGPIGLDGEQESSASAFAEQAHPVVAGRTLLWLAGAQATDSQTAGEAKRLMRVVLRPLLGDRPIATRSLFRRPDVS